MTGQACPRCAASGCPARPQRVTCADREACEVLTLAECLSDIHRYCQASDCEVAAQERAQVISTGVAATSETQPLAVVMLATDQQDARAIGTYSTYRVAGPARTRAGRRPGEPVGYAKAWAAVVCVSGHWH
jgi:hypothetical protein